MACLATVAVEFLVISLLPLLKVELGRVEVYIVYIYYCNVLRFATLVAVVVNVSFT
jgi:hypothetical protein